MVQRDWNKKFYPGAFAIGAGGSVLKGETPIEGAKRELYRFHSLINKLS